MYGSYDLPFSVEKEEISISVEKIEKLWVYKRTLGTETVERTSKNPDLWSAVYKDYISDSLKAELDRNSLEKLILGDGKHLIINPVEPLNTPKEITPHLLIELEKPLLLAGGTRRKIYLTFPVEIGVFISDKGNKNLQLLDVFTLARQKFTLYGQVSNGVVCKHWKSGIHSVPPSPNPLQEGIMELTLRNTTSEWASISKAVFSAYGMRLYYDADVFMRAHMDIRSRDTAETGFEMQHISGELTGNYPENQNTRKEAIEIFNRKLDFVPMNFDMRFGF